MFMLIALSGYDVTLDLLGIIAGHVYYFLEDVVPRVPETRACRVMKAPNWLTRLCTALHIHDFGANDFVDEGGFGFGLGWGNDGGDIDEAEIQR